MDVVADVGCRLWWVVGAEDVMPGRTPMIGLQDHGDEMRFGVVVFTDGAVHGAAAGVEISERGRI